MALRPWYWWLVLTYSWLQGYTEQRVDYLLAEYPQNIHGGMMLGFLVSLLWWCCCLFPLAFMPLKNPTWPVIYSCFCLEPPLSISSCCRNNTRRLKPFLLFRKLCPSRIPSWWEHTCQAIRGKQWLWCCSLPQVGFLGWHSLRKLSPPQYRSPSTDQGSKCSWYSTAHYVDLW